MTPELLRQIAQACDRILTQPHLGPEWLALPWLHFHSNHPLFLELYQSLGTETPNTTLENAWRQASRLFKTELSLFLRTWWHQYRQVEASLLTPDLPDPPGTAEVLILSWLVNVQHLDREQDFYFGDLQDRFAERGCSSLLVLRNGTDQPMTRLLPLVRRQHPWPRMMLAEDRPAIARLGLVQRCWQARGQLQLDCLQRLSPLEQQIAIQARNLLISPAVIQNLWLQCLVTDLCRRVRPKVVITLYEGHAWERCVWQAARRVLPSVLCVGYQHTILLQGAHAVKRSLSPTQACDPDLIWTLGDVTRRMLQASPNLKSVQVSTLGTHRYLDTVLAEGPQRRPVVLVLPEGLPNECLCLFNFAIACAQRLPQVQFIFRNHPGFAFETIAAELTDYHPDCPNIEVSRDRSLAEDFCRAGYLLYRGSSTSIYGILAGLKPFYLAQAGEINRDPLFELSVWREEVETVDQWLARYHHYESQSLADLLPEWQQARDYCQAYAQPLRDEAIDEMLALALAQR